MDHRIGLQLEKRAGPRPPYNERPPTDRSPGVKWDQSMYVKYSRTRADFPHLKPSVQPPQEP